MVMDELVAKACQYAGLESRERPAASNISGIRHRVGAYMSKYLTKQMPVTPESLPKEWEELIPRQWFNQSKACKAMVDGATVELPPAFSAFVVRQQNCLSSLDAAVGGYARVGWKKRKSKISDRTCSASSSKALKCCMWLWSSFASGKTTQRP